MKRLLLHIVATVMLILAIVIPLQAQGGVTAFSNLRINNFYRAQPRTAITVTANGTIDATGTYQPLTAAAALGTSGDNLVTEPAGTILFLVNVGAQTITITETANIKASGNVVLGTLDSATFVSNGTDWYQTAESDN